MKSILQDWVMELGLRYQGVLLTAVRGCDTSPKNYPSKLLVRCLRVVLLNGFSSDVRKAASFIEHVTVEMLLKRMNDFSSSLDHHPYHYLMHLMHAVEVVGYKHPDSGIKGLWRGLYLVLANGLYMTPETEAELDNRLNASEEDFTVRK